MYIVVSCMNIGGEPLSIFQHHQNAGNDDKDSRDPHQGDLLVKNAGARDQRENEGDAADRDHEADVIFRQQIHEKSGRNRVHGEAGDDKRLGYDAKEVGEQTEFTEVEAPDPTEAQLP
jgi:hypothetical protein